ncbi:MAG: hypothetical protein H6706_22785 [Myxococcales bacterium]|nr:hypothetical protein [Myxococcales bacterium]
MTDLDALRAAFERGRITDGSRLAGQYEADPAALRALAKLALDELPAGPADGEDEAAWAVLDEADPLGAPDLVVPDAPVVVQAAFAGPEVVAPMAPLVIKPKRSHGWLWATLAVAGVAAGAFVTWRIMDQPATPPATVAAAPSSAAPATAASAAPATSRGRRARQRAPRPARRPPRAPPPRPPPPRPPRAWPSSPPAAPQPRPQRASRSPARDEPPAAAPSAWPSPRPPRPRPPAPPRAAPRWTTCWAPSTATGPPRPRPGPTSTCPPATCPPSSPATRSCGW